MNNHISIPTANASIDTATAVCRNTRTITLTSRSLLESWPQDQIGRAKRARDTIGKMVSKPFQRGVHERDEGPSISSLG